MIKINLAERKTTQVGLNSQKKSQFKVGNLDLSQVQDLPIKKAIMPVVAGLIAAYALDFYKEEALTKSQHILDKLNAENKTISDELAKSKDQEALKKQLDQDELAIKSKLGVIKTLVAGRNVPLKILLTVSSSMPQSVWLREIKLSPETVLLSGNALELSPISDFMKSMKESQYFASVDLIDTQQNKDARTGVEKFELSVKRR